VLRDSREVDVQGRWLPAARVSERRGLWISGALIAEAEPLTGGLIAGSPALMVHHVSPGSEAESAGLMDYDLLMTVDAAPVDSLAKFLEHARRAEAADQPLELMLLRLGWDTQEALFIHERRLLPVEEVQLVGPQ
jgi:hypothetical protein